LNASGEEAQDRSALAVIVFQLLNFGIHPFTGRPANDRVPTDVPSRIAARLYAYGLKPNNQLSPTPSSGHAAMPADLRQLFDRAFEGTGGARPSPVEWGAALRPYAQRASLKLVKCGSDGEHQHFAGLPCAACARAALISKTARGARQPLPVVEADTESSPSPGARVLTGFGKQGLKPNHPGRGRKGKKAKAAARKQPGYTPFNRPVPTVPPYGTPPNGRKIATFALILFFLGVFAFFQKEAERTGTTLSTPANDARAATPAGEQSAPEAYLGPIAVNARDDSFFGPPTPVDITVTAHTVSTVASAAGVEDRPVLDEKMAGQFPGAPFAPERLQSRREEAARRFQAFAAERSTFTDPHAGMAVSYQHLQEDPYDAGAACEWSWQAQVDERWEYARLGFLRAIWADPHAACGWLGMSIYATDDAQAYGLLLTAATLQPQYPEIHERLAAAVFPAGSNELLRWRILDARAQLRASQLRGETPSNWAARLAQQQLPGHAAPPPPP